jgi:hypothetical protein
MLSPTDLGFKGPVIRPETVPKIPGRFSSLGRMGGFSHSGRTRIGSLEFREQEFLKVPAPSTKPRAAASVRMVWLSPRIPEPFQ